jgi:hypothetical protein
MADSPDTGATTTTPDAAPAAKTFTQDQVNALIAREKGQIQRQFADYDDLKSKAAKLDEIETANQTELQKLTTRLDRLKGELDPLKGENLRLRVAMDKKLPAELVDRLRGGTEDELKADADKLLELVKPATEPPPNATDFDGGVRPPVTPPASAEDAHQEFVKALLRRPTRSNH